VAKIALFTPYLPAPAFTGGRIRISELALGLQQLGEVHLFAQAGFSESAQAKAAPELAQFSSVQIARRLVPTWPWSKLPKRVLRGSPTQQRAALRAAGPFDLAVVEHSHAARWALTLDAPLLLDEHNIESRYLAAKLEALKQGRGLAEVQKLEVWERHLWREAEGVVAVTQSDAEHIATFRGSAPEVIPNGVNLGKIRFIPASERLGSGILFVGLMDHAPNVAAAKMLAENVMPAVWRVCPEAQLTLCGANPTREVLRLGSARVAVTGRVASVAPFLEQARVCAMPLSQGAGSSLKILEALASGLPLVASEVAVRGFALKPGTDYLPAIDAETTAAHIVTLLNAAGDDARARSGRQFAEAFDWAGLAQRFTSLASDLIKSPKRRTAKR